MTTTSGRCAASGSPRWAVPTDAAGPVVGWVVIALGATAIGSGLAGGPWLLRGATTAWVLPSRVGPAVIRRATFVLLAATAATGAVVGGVVVASLDASDTAPARRAGLGALSGSVVAVVVVALAVLVHPRTRVAFAAAGCLVVACAVVAWASWTGDGSAPALGVAASGGIPSAAIVWSEVAVALAAALGALVVSGRARVERLDARARAVGVLSVILFHQDLRSLLALRHRLTGEAPTARPRRRGFASTPALLRRPVPRRHLDALRRSPLRRVCRIAALVGASTWGWWLVWLRSPVLGVATVVITSWLIALELAEPLGQELDRPMLAPRPTLRHRLAHLATAAPPAAVLLLIPAFLLYLVIGDSDVLRAALAIGPGIVVTSLAGASHVLLRPDVELDLGRVVMPEAYGIGVVVRELIPPVVVAVGLLPLLVEERWTTSSRAAFSSGLWIFVTGCAVLAAVLVVAAVRQHRTGRAKGMA